jgi:hypothetical protein
MERIGEIYWSNVKGRKLSSIEQPWEFICGKKEFQGVPKQTMMQKAREIRAAYMGAEDIARTVWRIWEFVRKVKCFQLEVPEYLKMYEDYRDVILAQVKCLAMTELQEADDETRMAKFKRLVMLQATEEKQTWNHQEHRTYRVWWLAATKGVKFTRADLEWTDAEIKWGEGRVRMEGLRK